MSTEALEALIQRAHRRRDQVHTEDVPELPDLAELHERTIIGTYSYYGLVSQSRKVWIPGAIRLDGCIETPSAIARDYIGWKYGRAGTVRKGQLDVIRGGSAGVPLYAQPCRFRHGWYLDVQSAYYSILNVVGWDVDYWPEKWLGRGEPPADFPFPEHKRARNCLVSCAIGGDVPCYDPSATWADRFEPLKVANALSNQQLWRLVRDVLMSIGAQAVLAGAVYVNTDGYIVTDESAKAQLEQIIADWGLKARLKAWGAGRVVTHGVYDIGRELHSDPQRHPANARPAMIQQRVNYVPYASWLQKRFAALASVTGKVLGNTEVPK